MNGNSDGDATWLQSRYGRRRARVPCAAARARVCAQYGAIDAQLESIFRMIPQRP